MDGIRELVRVYNLFLLTAYEGWNSDREAWATISRKGHGHSGIHVKDQRVYEAMERLDKDAGKLAIRYLERLEEIGAGR